MLEFLDAGMLDKIPYYVRIEEKIDGSNVAVQKHRDGSLTLQSRTQILDPTAPQSFNKFVRWAEEYDYNVGFMPDFVYYGEMVGMGKLKYPSAPPFLLFDIRHSNGSFLPTAILSQAANDMSRVPVLYEGAWKGIDHARGLLGRSKINDQIDAEGIVIKAHNVRAWYIRASDNERVEYNEPLLVAKIVREDFAEVKHPKTSMARVDDPLDTIAESVVTSARIDKAVQRLQEEGRYDPNKPHLLIPILTKDIHDEEGQQIRDWLFSAHWKPLTRKIAARTVALINKEV